MKRCADPTDVASDDEGENFRVALESAQEQLTRLTDECAALSAVNHASDLRILDLQERLREAEEHQSLAFSLRNETARLNDSLLRHFSSLQTLQARFEESAVRLAEAREALHVQRESHQLTLRSLSEGVITTDANGNIEYLNPAAEQVIGWILAEARGRQLSWILRLRGESTGAPILAAHWRDCLDADQPLHRTGHGTLMRRDGAVCALEYSAAPIRIQSGETLGLAVIFRDVTEKRRMEAQIALDAIRDPLTGMINRREFECRLERAVARTRKTKTSHVLAYIDLDNFKYINDLSGHEAGDRLLRSLNEILAPNIRERDTLCRLGGDEFAVLLEACSLEDGMRICKGLLDSMRRAPFYWEGRSFDLRASIGAVSVDAGDQAASGLLRRADQACYAAKRRGGDQICVYADERNGRSNLVEARILPVVAPGGALDRDRLRLYYQPIVPLNDGETSGAGFEVLLRSIDDNNQVLNPDVLIPAAERYGLMHKVDRWVIETAASYCADRSFAAGGLVSINLSGRSVNDPTLPTYLDQVFSQSGVPPSLFCFEITETCVIDNLNEAASFVQGLKARGCSVSLDDFGSGLSSFSYLKAMPVDYVKICGTFVKDMLENDVDYEIVAAIQRIAKMMGLKTVAEHVHTTDLIASLRSLGVDYLQGNALGAASPLEGRLFDTEFSVSS